MNISPVFASYVPYRQNFCGIRDKYKNTDIHAKDIIRQRLEEKLPSNEYDSLYRKLTNKGRVESNKLNSAHKKEGINILQTLKDARVYAATECIPGKVYTGQSFIAYSDIPKVNALKDAGIKTAIPLISPALCDLYEEKAKELGLNYCELSNIGNKSLSVRDFTCIEDLVDKPSLYQDVGKRKDIDDLKLFIRILNGEEENFPPPIYMGCEHGTERTFIWRRLYQILKDAPQNKSLDDETVEKLIELLDIIEDTRRH